MLLNSKLNPSAKLRIDAERSRSIISQKSKFKPLLLPVLVFMFFFFFATNYQLLITISAEPDCNNPGPGDIDYCLEKIGKEIDALSPAHEYNKKELSDLRTQITGLEKKIKAILNQLTIVEKDIEKREEDLEYASLIFVEKNKLSLSNMKAQVDKRAEFLAGEVDRTEKYLSSLSAKQEELIALKAGGFQTSVGDTPPTLEPCSGPPGSSNFCDPGFRPAYAAFSFGAPHRTGMSQYGAYGRSKSGQSVET